MKGSFWVCDREFVGFVYEGIWWVCEKCLDLRIDIKNLVGRQIWNFFFFFFWNLKFCLVAKKMCKSILIFLKINLSSRMLFFTTLSPLVGTVCVCFCVWLTRNGKKMLENLGVWCYISIWVCVHCGHSGLVFILSLQI